MTLVPNTEQHPVRMVDHGPRPGPIKGVVCHTIEGSDEGAVSWFQDPAAGGVGAPLVIGYKPPRAVQIAGLDRMVWHAAGANANYVGIEHEGYTSDTAAQWLLRRTQRKLSANRVAWICYHYGLGVPTRGRNVFGHIDFPAGGHGDPGVGFWCHGLYMKACVRAYRKLQKSNGRSWK